jgi:DUF971 family protein
MKPVSIKKFNERELSITWDDGHAGRSSVEYLRDCCPCAGCKGETVLLHTYTPPPEDRGTPGRYEITGIQPVGSYAVQLFWNDGHSTGIYAWDLLRALCECEICVNVRREGKK